MFVPLPTPTEIARWDQAAVNHADIPALLLMENAGKEAFRVLCSSFATRCKPVDKIRQDPGVALAGKRMLCFMGGGNNGGDAAVVARHAAVFDLTVIVVHHKPLAAFQDEAAWHIRQAQQAGIVFVPYDNASRSVIPAQLTPEQCTSWNHNNHPVPAMPDIVVDGVLGAGLRGDVAEQVLPLIRHINMLGQHAFVLALDVPSGMNAISGLPAPECVKAHCTVTFQAPKPGLMLPAAFPHRGTLHIRDIGIPKDIQTKFPPQLYGTTDKVGLIPPLPEPDMYKGKAGHVVILGGSPGLSGATILTALGALRAGAGLVTIALPEQLEDQVKAAYPDIMTLPLTCSNANWSGADISPLPVLLERCNALVIGNGMGRSPHSAEVLQKVLHMPRPTTILDADALFHIRHPSPLLALMREMDILTPHPGEMAFLTGLSRDQVQADRHAALRLLMQKTPATCLLKGAGSMVGNRAFFTALVCAGAPSLAVGGTGDVLAGICAAFAAQGISPFKATTAAAHIHGKAGELLLQKYPLRGITASEIADALPLVRKELYHA